MDFSLLWERSSFSPSPSHPSLPRRKESERVLTGEDILDFNMEVHWTEAELSLLQHCIENERHKMPRRRLAISMLAEQNSPKTPEQIRQKLCQLDNDEHLHRKRRKSRGRPGLVGPLTHMDEGGWSSTTTTPTPISAEKSGPSSVIEPLGTESTIDFGLSVPSSSYLSPGAFE